MVAADRVLFNSAFHRDVVFDHLPGLLRRFPDFTHEPFIDQVRAKTSVLPVGVDLASLDRIPRVISDPPTVLWNQRWEFDKNPAAFFDALYRLDADGVPFRLIVCGENFRQVPGEFDEARRRLADHIVHFGFAPVDRYRELLRNADVVVSTARQEFFGIAIVEAIYAGAFPLLPRRLSYPEIIPAEFHDAVLYDDADFADRLRWALEATAERRNVTAALRDAMASYDWSTMAPRYDTEFEHIVERRRPAN
jgi:glycosyltransferase involved in cell wall biosynthesis